jgi:hypothetical protein
MSTSRPRERLLGERREDQLALLAFVQRGAAAGVDHLDQEVVLLHVQARARRTLRRHARAAHLRQPVEHQRGEAKLALDLGAHLVGEGLAAEQTQLESQLVDLDPRLTDGLCNRQRVGGRRCEHLCAEVAQQHRLARREPARHGDHRRPDPLPAVVEPVAAREQPVAVRVVDDHPRSHSGHRHAARHQLGPRFEVRARVADHRGLAVRPA